MDLAAEHQNFRLEFLLLYLYSDRIVIVSSLAHEIGRMHWDDLNWEKSYNANDAYAQSKLANVLHAKELARRLESAGAGVSVYCVHPGVVATDLWRHADKRWYGKFLWPVQKLAFKTPLQGAQTTIYCCVEVGGGGVSLSHVHREVKECIL